MAATATAGRKPVTSVLGARSSSVRPILLLAPSLVLLAGLFLYPLVSLTWQSFSEPSLGVGNYREALSSSLVWHVLRTTFEIAGIVTVICLLCGYPVAYVLANASPTVRRRLLVFVLVPFWTSTLIRTYSWVVILGRHGTANSLLDGVGIGEQPLLYNRTGTLIGMTHIMLPYMILALYPILLGIDKTYSQASASLGASGLTTFRRVYLPLSVPGILAGTMLVFILSLGFFITPALLGGPRDLMASVYIDTQVERLLNWGLATSVSVILLALTLVLTAVLRRLVKTDTGALVTGR
jgi:ABC-type spermidine/putrescine transport system permease subunit I